MSQYMADFEDSYMSWCFDSMFTRGYIETVHSLLLACKFWAWTSGHHSRLPVPLTGEPSC